MAFRRPTSDELRLLERLFSKAQLQFGAVDWQSSLKVEDMDDGGMGSLRLALSNKVEDADTPRAVASDLQFTDADGVEVIASLYLDASGTPSELSVWKTDFRPLLRIPSEI